MTTSPVFPSFVGALQMALHVVRLVDFGLVVVETKPLHDVEKGADGLGRGALEVGVLHAEEELAADMAGVEPVEDCGADVADVNLSRG